jgi:methyl-accepting chemotaxis protein
MKFKTKIWMLPLSAALVFVIGVAVSFFVGSRTSAGLNKLARVDDPFQVNVMNVDRAIEQFRMTLQAATSEGDASRLSDVEPVVASARAAVSAMQKLDGKAEVAREMGGAFEAYQAAAAGATRAMLDKNSAANSTELVGQMQTTQAALEKIMTARKKEARDLIDAQQLAATQGVRLNLWVVAITGLAVLVVLGAASKLILASVWRDLGDEPTHLRNLVQQIADGDLSADVRADAGDHHSLLAAVAGMSSKLRGTVAAIRQATDSISTASTEIASGNQDLSTRTEHTASNLQQTASSMEQLTGTVRQSADAARQANQLASSAASAAQRGGNIVSQVVVNMDEINTASRKINEIIGVIDGIAFQTNILALNAAVEAARAGEQGRGFAVVAGEVRSLAQRSANAAKEIKSLINASSEKVESGSKLVQDAGGAMSEIVSGVQRVTDIIGEITAASAEQSSGIGQVNTAVTQLDQMTQQNAALVEESAAAAESLREQAARLAEAVAIFRLGMGGESSRPAVSAPVAQATPVAVKPAAPVASKVTPSAAKSALVSTPKPATVVAAANPAPVAPAAPVARATPAPAMPTPSAPDDDWETF